MGLLNYLEFDGVNSLAYGVTISGGGTYDAPKRRAEVISIPGRDGDFILEDGSYENVTVTYDAFIATQNDMDFNDKLQAFRSEILSRKGYLKLTDSYHGDEYRLAAYVSGLDVETALHNKAGSFKLTFNCKPQRFLKSGELPVSVASGDVINNPTLFDSKPLITFNASGDGAITIGDKTVSFYNSPLGIIELPHQVTQLTDHSQLVGFSGSYNTGDTFTFKGMKFTVPLTAQATVMAVPSGNDLRYRPDEYSKSGNTYNVTFEDYQESTFVIGTSKTVTKSATIEFTISGTTYNQTMTLTIRYTGASSININLAVTLTGGVTKGTIIFNPKYVIKCDSSANSLTGDLYMDLDIGEAYRIVNDSVVSINNYTNLGSDLPTLPSGDTTITFSNTISNVKITPRYWRI